MAYNPNNPNGQATADNSAPVVLASNVVVTGSLVEIATGGATMWHTASAASTNATVIKSAPGKVTGWYIYNANGSARKVAFHNTAGAPTAGTAVYFSIPIPALSAANCPFPAGIDFSAGIAITTTTGLADSDTAAVALNDLIINILYK